jgi:CRP/FNR family transcriptional regulator, cyclic AMP receptor protein
MLSRNIHIEESPVDQLFNSSEKRLARALLLLARYGLHEKPGRALLPISQETLAQMIGTTPGVYRLRRWAHGEPLAAHGRLA